MRTTAADTEAKGGPFGLTPLDLDEPRPDEVSARSGHTEAIVGGQWCPMPLPAGFRRGVAQS